ncbi:SPX domain-containing protein 4-like [Apium graveolens]|uniref:SPX domain-containing protein 4-like n=1 Tax=Apium graveolens TaxID=4045 RepID=UPI003D7B6D9C
MKFGKEFRIRIEEILPAWRDNYLCYKTLKKILKRFPFTDDVEHRFLLRLHQELGKINDFYVDEEEELVIKFQDLNARIERVREIIRSGTRRTELHDVIIRILIDFFNIQAELVVLKNYCFLNYLGLTKILKKHDKRTGGGGSLRIPFIHLVRQQPYFTAEPLTQLLQDCEANLAFLL